MIAPLCAIALWSSAVRADFSPWSSDSTETAAPAPALREPDIRLPKEDPPAFIGVEDSYTGEALRLHPLHDPAGLGEPAAASESEAGEFRSLPGLPGSARLFLSAVLSLAAWQALRSTRHLHLSALPDWYHSGGPVQIGHAVPFDLDCSELPLRPLETAVVEPPAGCGLTRIEHCRPWTSQYAPVQAAPRGPPCLI
jgi:hypothetical protein